MSCVVTKAKGRSAVVPPRMKPTRIHNSIQQHTNRHMHTHTHTPQTRQASTSASLTRAPHAPPSAVCPLSLAAVAAAASAIAHLHAR